MGRSSSTGSSLRPRAAHRGNIVHLHGIQSHGGVVRRDRRSARAARVLRLPHRPPRLRTEQRRRAATSRARRQLVDDVRGSSSSAQARRRRADVRSSAAAGARARQWRTRSSRRTDSRRSRSSAPALKAKVDLTPARQAARLHRPRIGPMRPIPSRSTPELFTDNPPYLEFVRNDPLSPPRRDGELLLQAVLWDRQLLAETLTAAAGARCSSPADDPIVDAAPSAPGSTGSRRPRKQYVLYPRASATSSTSRTERAALLERPCRLARPGDGLRPRRGRVVTTSRRRRAHRRAAVPLLVRPRARGAARRRRTSTSGSRSTTAPSATARACRAST